jgi:hypothetical protein
MDGHSTGRARLSIYLLGSPEFPEFADIDLKQANLHMPGLGWEGFVAVMGE